MSTTLAPTSLAELAELLRPLGAQLVGEGDELVQAISEDSRKVTTGTLFVARKGERADGTRFVGAALAAGASAVLCEKSAALEVHPRIEVDDLPRAWGIVAQRLAGEPSRSMAVVGITGTNGKTTTASLVEQALARLGKVVARIGTLGFEMNGEKLADTLTTPQPDELAWILAEAKRRDAEVCVMEVSSHALAQWRVAGVLFDVAAFCNLSQDHLDFHETWEAYGEAKSRLFAECAPRASVINVADAYGRQIAERQPPTWSVGIDVEARLQATGVDSTASGTRFVLHYDDSDIPFRSPLVGAHNAENLLVASGILLALGFSLKDAALALASAESVPGRLERCDGPDDDIVVLVDYAHTPHALESVLDTLRALGPSRLGCVFGCGGDRDRSKRAPMGRAAASRADDIWVTSDNPRSEDPSAIINEIREGLRGCRATVVEEVNRAAAIHQAVLSAEKDSVLLVAGKGHETYQLVGDAVLDFDDRVEVRKALRRRRGEAS